VCGRTVLHTIKRGGGGREGIKKVATLAPVFKSTSNIEENLAVPSKLKFS